MKILLKKQKLVLRIFEKKRLYGDLSVFKSDKTPTTKLKKLYN